jgi:pyruvate dehydrogenase E2 component (dihydrolipoamide acetyltransferase)
MTMPSLGADMASGTLLEWLVEPGADVHRGDVVAVVDTDKAEIEIECFEDGVVEELLVDAGRTVDVGTPIARIGGGNGGRPQVVEPEPAPEPRPAPEPVAQPEPEPEPEPAPVAAPRPADAQLRASPLARRVAADLGVDLRAVAGTGPHGAVLRADVERAAGAAPAPAPAAPAPPRDRQAGLRRAIASLMARSKREIPHYGLQTTVDLAAASAWLERRNAGVPVAGRVLPAALLLRATALAAADHPAVNGHWVDGGLRSAPAVHLGVAVALRGGGVVAPAIRDAASLGVDELMAALTDLVGRARAGRLRATEMTEGTITVTALGDRGADLVHGVIFPPQVALVGFGRIASRPVAVDGLVGARPTVLATLAGDHRASDGHAGSRFLTDIDRLLQTPEDL